MNLISGQHRPYAFTIGVTTVNAQQGFERLGGHEKVPTLQFKRNLARQFLNNSYIPKSNSGKQIQEAKRRKADSCRLLSLPKNTCFSVRKIVKCKGKYNRFTCVCGKERVGTYCTCSPGFIWCSECFAIHCLDTLS